MTDVTTHPDVTPGQHRRPRFTWTRRRIVLASAGGVLLLLVLSAVAVLVQGLHARTTLTSAIPLVEQVEQGIRSGDSEQTQAAVAELAAATSEARDSATGPHWWLAGAVPWLGQNVRAVSTTAVVIDDITQQVLVPLVDVAGTLDVATFSADGGLLDLEALTEAEPALSGASDAFAAASAKLNAVDPDELMSPIAGPVRDIQDYLGSLGPLVNTGASAARLLPPMLGAQEPRTYLVMFQNTAEMRATGGVASAFAIIEAENGELTIVHQGTAGQLGLFFDEPVLALDPGKESIYTTRLGQFFSGVNLSPDFPTAAQLAAEMARRAGFDVDGVIATDTIALSYLLEATGPVAAPTGVELTQDNAVTMLLSDVYWTIDDQGRQDEFFAGAAAGVFAAITGGETSPTELVYSLTDAAAEHRLLVWSADEDEQRELLRTVLSGAFDDTSPSPSAVGVFFNDGTSAKLQYYLDSSIEHVETICTDDRRYDRLAVTMAYTAPAEALTDFPRDVTGVGNTGVPTGLVRTNVYFYGGADGEIREVLRDGVPVDSAERFDGARPVRVFTTELAPGESVVFDVQFEQPDRGEPVPVWATPTVTAGGLPATAPPCD